MLYKLPAFQLILLLAFILVYSCHLAVCTRTAKWSFSERWHESGSLFRHVAPVLAVTAGVAVIALFAGPYGALKLMRCYQSLAQRKAFMSWLRVALNSVAVTGYLCRTHW